MKLAAPSAFMTSITTRLSSPPFVGRAVLAPPSEGDIYLSFDIDNRSVARFLESLAKRGLVGHAQILFFHSYMSLLSKKMSSIRLEENFQKLKRTSNLTFSQRAELRSQRRFTLFLSILDVCKTLNSIAIG